MCAQGRVGCRPAASAGVATPHRPRTGGIHPDAAAPWRDTAPRIRLGRGAGGGRPRTARGARLFRTPPEQRGPSRRNWVRLLLSRVFGAFRCCHCGCCSVAWQQEDQVTLTLRKVRRGANHQDGRVLVGEQPVSRQYMGTEQIEDVGGWTVPRPYPDHLGRRAAQQRLVREVGVSGNNGKAMALCVPPYDVVGCLFETSRLNVNRAWIQIRKRSGRQARREVLIEEQLHKAEMSWERSLSAA